MQPEYTRQNPECQPAGPSLRVGGIAARVPCSSGTGSFTFDSASHVYALDGVRLPSVTDIVRAVLPQQWPVDQWYLDRGSMVHRALALFLRGDLDDATVDERIRGFVAGAMKAIADNGWTANEQERPMLHSTLRFAGRPDLLTESAWLVDWKTGTAAAAVEVQLGGYALLYEAERTHVAKCAAVELHEDGTYKLEVYKTARCSGLFRSALSIYQWMQANGKGGYGERRD